MSLHDEVQQLRQRVAELEQLVGKPDTYTVPQRRPYIPEHRPTYMPPPPVQLWPPLWDPLREVTCGPATTVGGTCSSAIPIN